MSIEVWLLYFRSAHAQACFQSSGMDNSLCKWTLQIKGGGSIQEEPPTGQGSKGHSRHRAVFLRLTFSDQS